jgi:energy-coupling factor transport system permease protein
MNEFEFLRGLPFGPYLSTSSPILRFDPRTRILAVIILMVALLLTHAPLGIMVGLVGSWLIWWVGRVPFEPLRRSWVTAFPFLLILALIQIVFHTGGEGAVWFTVGPVAISGADLWAGVILILRFSAFIALLGLAAASLSESEITHGLQSLLHPLNYLHIPASDFVMAVQVSLRYFPLLAQSAERIAKAQASRGADWRPAGWNLVQRARQIVPMVVPLFVTSLRRAENMALAMDARAYGSLPVRTSLVSLAFRRRDALALVAIFIWAGLIVLL